VPGVTLRRRVAALAVVIVTLMVLMGVLVGSRFSEAVSAGIEVFTALEPAADDADTLVRYRIEGEGDLQDYVLSGEDTAYTSFRQSLEQADSALSRLRFALTGYPRFAPLLDRADSARTQWWGADAGPTIAAVRTGRPAEARQRTQSAAARSAYEEYVASATALQDSVDDRREEQFALLADFTRQLAGALVAAGVMLLLLVVLIGALLERWVLTPLDSLRRQLRQVARRGEHHRPIQPSGPPELRAAGADAETLRRQLVEEIDEARAAREGLAQDAPVVAAIQRELRPPADPARAGVRLHGEVQAAEGVLAGDSWDWVATPDGGTAVVVTDVSGHGAEAGLTAIRVRNAVRPVLEAGGDAGAALAVAATGFAGEEARFATVVIARVDPASGLLRWANAGHHPPLVLRSAGEVETLDRTGPLLSALGGEWTESGTTLRPGDLLVAYTDGLVESRDAEGAELGEDGLLRLLSRVRADGRGDDPDELVSRLVAAARERSVDWRRDDVTVVALSLAGPPVRSSG
jgi:serine phosphatase RsbU (regulator of sigma subunit)/CHASE3 domain sensor protein